MGHGNGGNSSKQSEPLSSEMSEQQAFEILGLAGASEKEMLPRTKTYAGVHPDRGGSTILAAKINAAKDLLVG